MGRSTWVFRCTSFLLVTLGILVVWTPVPQRGLAPSASTVVATDLLEGAPHTTEVSFEPNLGQTDPAVKYIARGSGRPLFLKTDGLIARLRDGASEDDHIVEMKIVDANPEAKSAPLDPRTKRSNYFIGDDPDKWQRAVPHFGRVRFEKVYPGIDLVYRDSEGPSSTASPGVAYDFIVNPGAAPSRIRLKFEGVDGLSVDENGDLLLATAVGELRQRRPVVYQEIAELRRPVEGRFDLHADGQVGFTVGPYERTAPLVIDPTIEYATYLGGSGEDQAFDIVVGSDGGIYVTGWTESINFADVAEKGGADRDAFVTRHISREQIESLPTSQRATLDFTSFYGGFFDDQGQSIQVDSDGNAYITGWVGPGASPTTDGSSPGGGLDAFAAVFDPTGDLLHAERVGGPGDDLGWGIDAIRDGVVLRVITSGATSSRSGLISGDPWQEEYGGGDSDGFIRASSLRLDETAGSGFVVDNQATSYLGGNGTDIVDSITFGKFSVNLGVRTEEYNVFAASTTNSAVGMPISETAPIPDRPGGTDGHLTALRLDPSGAPAWGESDFGTYLPGGPGTEREVRLAGFTEAFSGSVGGPLVKDRLYFFYNAENGVPTAENAPVPDYPGGPQSFVLTFLESDREVGEPRFVGTTYGGGNEFDQGADLALDPNGRPGVVGFTFSQLNTSRGAIHGSRRGAFSGFFLRYASDLSRIDYSTYTWGSQNSNATAIDFNGFGVAQILGIVGPGEQMTPNAFQENHQGGPWDAAIEIITQPFLFNNGIGNGASFRPGASPQQISVAVGGQIGPQTPVFLTVDQDGQLLEALGDASILVDAEPSPMTFASEIQNNFIFRFNVGFRFNLSEKGKEPPVVEVQVNFGELSNIVEVPVMEANPGLFAADGSGQGQGAILNPNFTVNSAENPAPGDSYIVLFGTGGGLTDPVCPDGGFGPGAEPLPRLQLPVQVFVDGVEAQVPYAGSAPGLVCGVNQYNVVPMNNPSGPAVPVQACVNDVCSNIVTVAFL